MEEDNEEVDGAEGKSNVEVGFEFANTPENNILQHIANKDFPNKIFCQKIICMK